MFCGNDMNFTMNITEKKAKAVQSMFSSIAENYDFLNHFLSLGMDKAWRKKAAACFDDLSNKHILDVACGTGDLSIAVMEAGESTTMVTGGDFSESMLKTGRGKIKKMGIESRINFQLLDVLNIDCENNVFDGVSCAFGIRNFADLNRGLSEMIRVLKPGGRIVILEFAVPTNRLLASFYKFYFTQILPCIGGLLSGNKSAYKYLPDTVYRFPTADKIIVKLETIGLKDVKYVPLTLGICNIFTGIKI